MELVEGVARVSDVDAFIGTLDEIGDRHGVAVQAFDARAIVDETHLRRAVALADRSIARGENVARDRGVEILLCAAGRRQIDQALALGVSEGEVPVVVVVAGPPDGATAPSDADPRDDVADAAAAVRERLVESRPTLGEYDEERVRAYYDVTDAELDAVDGDLADLVHERVALLSVER